MKKLFWVIPVLGLFIGLFSVEAEGAKPDFEPAFVSPSGNRPVVKIPERAVEITPGVFSLGTATENGREVEGYAFVHYAAGEAKPASASEEKSRGEPKCYRFLARGAKWKSVEPYIIDPTNDRDLDESFVSENLALNIDKWEDAADGAVDGTINHDILGDEEEGAVDGIDWDQPDDRNEVYFADIEPSGAVGITVIWIISRGQISERALIEWDQVYNQADYAWSSNGGEGAMDFENIATHELGHSVGLGDHYMSACSEQTMHGWVSYGETQKRSLEYGDIDGVRTLYSK